jgi:hypothetical protein
MAYVLKGRKQEDFAEFYPTPPNYGKRRKSDMSAEEKAVVDSFGIDYDKVFCDNKYYIVESSQFLLT